MKRDLPPLVFQTSILCIRPGKLKDGFYPALSETRHMYSAYDNTVRGSNYAVSDEDFASVICSQFEKNKWAVQRMHIGNPLRHYEKYLMLDLAFKGQKYLMPQVNQPNTVALVLGLQQIGVRIGPHGFQKDKTEEKNDETEESLLEHRTDGTDAFDTLMIGMRIYPVRGSVGEFVDIICPVFLFHLTCFTVDK